MRGSDPIFPEIFTFKLCCNSLHSFRENECWLSFFTHRRQLRLNLREIPTPWYEEWWPWTIIGVVVAGAVVAVVMVQSDEPDSGTVRVTIE